MTRLGSFGIVAGALVFVATGVISHAQSAASIDPAAVAALERMGAYLRTLRSFEVKATTTDEDVLEDGQKVQYAGVATIVVQMPGRLRAKIANDRHDRLFLYDGTSFTMFAERINYYATVPAPGTITQLADKLEQDFGLSVPLQDLFRWGSSGWKPDGLSGAMTVGPSVVDGLTCQHYAFRQQDIDWQIWIQLGEHPLPRRLVITTKTDEARPQHTAAYQWNLAPSFNEAAFKFNPPEGASRVVLDGLSRTSVSR